MKYFNKKTFGLIGLGLGLYVIFLIQQIPAQFAWGFAPADIKRKVQLLDIQGTIWSGKSSAVYINGMELGRLNWQLSPFSLLLGNVSVNTHIKGLVGEIEADFTFSASQITADDLSANLHAAGLNPFLANAFPFPVMLRGNINAEIESLTLQRGQSLQLQGQIEWQKASVEGVQSIELGKVNMLAEPNQNGSLLQLNNEKSPLAIDGTIQLLNNGQFDMKLGLMNKDNKREDLTTMLRFLGNPDKSGRYYFKQKGRLPL